MPASAWKTLHELGEHMHGGVKVTCRGGRISGGVLASIALLAATLFCAAVLTACGEMPAGGDRRGEAVSLDIAATPQPASAPVFVAQAKGFFADEGLDARIHLYSSGDFALRSVLASTSDVAMVAQTPLARAAMDGKRFSVIGTVARVENASMIVARVDRGIERDADLMGKTIGVTPLTSDEFFLHIYLAAHRIDPKDVSIVPLLPYELGPALRRGDVDAISTAFPASYEAERSLDGKVRIFDEKGFFTMAWSMVVRYDTPQQDRTADRLIRALITATEYMEEHPGEAKSIVARKIRAPVGEVSRVWRSHRWEIVLDQSLLLELEDAARWMQADEGPVPPFDRYIDSRALRRIDPDRVTLIEAQQP